MLFELFRRDLCYRYTMIKTVTVHQACKQQQRQKQGPT